MSFLLAGIILASVYANTDVDRFQATLVFVLGLFLFDYFEIQIKLRGTSLIDRSTFSLFPLSNVRSLSIRFFLFLANKRSLFYLLPLLGTIIVFAANGEAVKIPAAILLFASTYLVMTEIFFLLYFVLRKLADRFSVRTATQIATIPFFLSFLFVSALHHKTAMLVTLPVISQFTKGFQEILASHFEDASIEAGYLLIIFIGVALAASTTGFLFNKTAGHVRSRLIPFVNKRVQEDPDSAGTNLFRKDHRSEKIGEKLSRGKEVLVREDLEPAAHIAWHLVLVDWLIHQREEKILYLLLLYPLMAIFVIVRIISRLHFEPGSLILPILFFTQILGFYFTEKHFTGHGLRLSHIVVTPLDPYKFVFAKTISTWGLLSLMNVFICVFCGVYLNMNVYVLAQATIYSVFLPLVLLQLANMLTLYFPGISRHPLISMLIIVISELILTAIYVLVMSLNFFVGVLLVSVIFVLSYLRSIPAWGKQLSGQLQILLEDRK